MRIDFKIKNDMLVLEKQRDTFSGNVNFYECGFDIQTNQELVWICVFKKGDKVYQQVIENGVCMIPAEVLFADGELEIGCYASSNTDKFQRISTNWVSVKVSKGAYSDGTVPQIPTKDVWEILMLKNVPYIGENGNWYIYDTEKTDYVDSGHSSVGKKGEKGDRGETGLSGTTNAANALKGNIMGKSVTLEDVSPIEHELKVKVKSKNIVYSATYIGDGSSSITGEPRQGVVTINKALPMYKGKTYTMSWDTENTGATVWVTFVSSYRSIISKCENYDKCDGTRKWVVFEMAEDCLVPQGWALQASSANTVNTGQCSNIMIEEGDVATEYTEYILDLSSVLVEITDESGRLDTVYPSEDDTLEDVVSSYPSMEISTDNAGVVLDVEYNKDINKAFSELEEKLTQAIISLGGNV